MAASDDIDDDLDDDLDDDVFILNREHKAWAKKLQKLFSQMPAGIEMLVGRGSAHIHPAGWYQREIWDAGMDMMRAGTIIEEAAGEVISFDENRIRPNSETC